MQHASSKRLFEYWNTVRNGRLAPDRFEIEPVDLADVLPDVFILECPDISTYRFRLAGTRICTALGHELRGSNLLDYWTGEEREAIHSLLHNVAKDGAGACMKFEGINADRERAVFEMLVLPLLHKCRAVNRMFGTIATLTRPYWTGTVELRRWKLTDFDLIWPDKTHPVTAGLEQVAVLADTKRNFAGEPGRRFRVLEGGLSRRSE